MDCRFHALKFFYCRRILFSCRFLAVETHEVNSDKYERNTEPLPHIQRHCLFKIHLVFFQEFDEEAEDEKKRDLPRNVTSMALEEALEQAIKDENYELAAKIRDRINSRNQNH